MAEGPGSSDRMFDGALDFLLFLIGVLAGLLFAYISYLVAAAAVRGESGDWGPALLGLALSGGVSALAWTVRSGLRAKRNNWSDQS